MAERNHLLSEGLLVMALIMLGKVTAFARDAVFSAQYGVSAEMDAFFVASNVPNLVFSAFFASVGIVFLPVFNRVRIEQGEEASEKFAGKVLFTYAMIALALSALCILQARFFVVGMAPSLAPETTLLAIRLTRILCASFVFSTLAGILSTILQAQRRYMGPQLIPTLNNVLTALVVIFLATRFDIFAAAFGALAAWALQVPFQAAFLRGRFAFRPSLRLRDPHLATMARLFLPVLISVSLDQAYIFTDNFLGSRLPAGNISALNYAQRLLSVASGTFVLAVTTITYPVFTEYIVRKEFDRLNQAVSRCLGSILLVTVPVIAIIGVFHQEVVALAFGRGRFDEAAVRLTALLLLGFAPGILFGAFRDTLNRVHYASQDSRTPMVLSACAVAVKIGLSLLLVRHYGVLGLALATCAAAATYSLLQFVLLKRSLGFAPFRGLARIGMQTLLAGAGMAAVGLGVREAARATGLIPSTAAGVGAAMLVYAILILALRVEPALHFAHSLRARFRHQP